MVECNLSSIRLNEIQNHDSFRVIWLSSDNNISEELNNFADYLTKCDTTDSCKKYIESFQSDRIILLVLIHPTENLSEFSRFRQIQSIYSLQRTPTSRDNSKFIHFFTEERALIERLRRDILLTYRHDLPIMISSLQDFKLGHGLLDFNRNRYTFLWNQLFFHSLVDDDAVDIDELKIIMIDQCRLEYRDNTVSLKQIEEFGKTCTKDNILRWYTQCGVFYDIVNRVLRTRNIDLIWKFRYFFILAYKKLKELSIQQQSKKKISHFYRGQRIAKTELDKLIDNVGHLMSVNSMLSTSLDEDVARFFFAGVELGVLFKITVPNTSDNILSPFADISGQSVYTDEEEILFFVGSVFRIDSVRRENDSTWIIELTLCNENVEQVEQIFDVIREQLDSVTCWQHVFMKVQSIKLFSKYLRLLTGHSHSLDDLVTIKTNVNFYHFLSVSGDCERELEFLQDLFNNRFIDESKRIVLHIVIGYNYFKLGNFDNALFHYGIVYTLLQSDNRLLGYVYMHIGDVWEQQQRLQDALSYYEMALEIVTRNNCRGRDVSEISRKIAQVYRQQENDVAAAIYESRADQNDSNRRQRTNFDIEQSLQFFADRFLNTSTDSVMQRARDLYSIGQCLLQKSKYSQALEKFLQAKELYDSEVSSSTYFIVGYSRLLYSISGAYALLKDTFQALITLKKAFDVLEGLRLT